MKIDLELDNARKADDADPLTCFHERFLIPKRTNDAEDIYAFVAVVEQALTLDK